MRTEELARQHNQSAAIALMGDNWMEGRPMANDVHPVDQVLPAPKLLTLGLQHVLVMYAGAVAVPLILGRALKLLPRTWRF
jgi:xanthine/uracil permease